MDSDLENIETMSPEEVAKALHKGAEIIRAGLKQNRFPFGTAVQSERNSGRWNYIIIKSKFLEFVGLQNTKDIDLKYIITNNESLLKELRKCGITTERELDEKIASMKKLNIGGFVNKIPDKKEGN